MSRERKDRARSAAGPFLALGLLVIAGAGVSAYLVLVHFQNLADPTAGSACNFGGWLDCDAVNTSEYSEVWGVPLAYFGLLFYAIFGTIAFQAAAREPRRAAAGIYLLVLSLAAVLESIYLAVVSTVLIKAFCLFCMVLYVLNAALLIIAIRLPGKRARLLRTAKRDARKLFDKPVVLAMAVVLLGLGIGATVYVQRKAVDVRDSVLKSAQGRIVAGTKEIGAVPGQVFGSRNAALSVFIFSDFECRYCLKAAKVFDGLIDRYKDRVRFVFKHFPLDPSCNVTVKRKGHRNACRAARAAVCAAAEGKFESFHRAVFKGGASRAALVEAAKASGLDGSEFSRCTESLRSGLLVESDIKDGISLGVQSTPTFVVGEKLLPGAGDIETLSKLIDQELTAEKKKAERR